MGIEVTKVVSLQRTFDFQSEAGNLHSAKATITPLEPFNYDRYLIYGFEVTGFLRGNSIQVHGQFRGKGDVFDDEKKCLSEIKRVSREFYDAYKPSSDKSELLFMQLSLSNGVLYPAMFIRSTKGRVAGQTLSDQWMLSQTNILNIKLSDCVFFSSPYDSTIVAFTSGDMGSERCIEWFKTQYLVGRNF